MATTRIIPMHINKGKTIAQCLKARVEYVKNPDKTDGGELISSYACAPETADQEFLLARNEYMAITGRRIHNEVIAYQLRQSFKPGEVTPEEANQIGYKLASRFLKGEHAFIVATHNDRRHVHNHIVFCATALDCTRKFRDILRSGKALAELSDQICEEHRLSVITEPKNQTVTYDKWLGESAKVSQRDMLRMTIDTALRMQPDGFDALMQMLEEAGCRIKRGAQISIKPPGAKRFIRLDTVGAEYTEEALRMSLAGKHVHIPKRSRGRMTKSQVERLIDIEAKLRSGKGKGYERWAERHNTDALASSMIYLKENHVGSYAELESRIQAALDARNALKSKIRAGQARMEEISRQKKAILVYRRTKEVYAKYRESGWSPAFYREHKADIEAHKEAQAVYSAADGKPPTLDELSEEYDLLLSQKRETGEELSRLSEELKNLRHIKSNMDTLLDDERYDADRHRHNELNMPECKQHSNPEDR